MGKASSAKKVARVARAGGSSKGTKRGRNLLFPVGIGLIVLLGTSLVVFARTSRDEAAATPPVANQDHWHAAYGVRLCGQGFSAPTQVQDDPVGIHTHGDGVIHIHPFTNAASGDNATLGQFFDAAGLNIDDDQIDLGGDVSVKEGEDTCGARDKPGIVQVALWANARKADTDDPVIITENIRDIAFKQDGAAYTIAFAPEGATIPPTPTIPQLDNLTDVPSSGSTATTVIDPATATSSVVVTPTTQAGATGSTRTTAAP